jgi:hypothetical protein
MRDPYCRILGFLDRTRYCFSHVAPQLYSRGWVNPVQDPLLLRKPGKAKNRTRTSGSVARNSDHQTTEAIDSFRVQQRVHIEFRKSASWDKFQGIFQMLEFQQRTANWCTLGTAVHLNIWDAGDSLLSVLSENQRIQWGIFFEDTYRLGVTTSCRKHHLIPIFQWSL